MSDGTLLGISVLLQLVAGLLAIKLIGVTGHRPAWSIVAMAMMFMAVRPAIALYRIVDESTVYHPDMVAEQLSLGISVLLLMGLTLIASWFKRVRRNEEALSQKSAILQATMENIGEGISLVDRDLNIVGYNNLFLKLLDFPTDLFGEKPRFEDAIRYNAQRGEYGPGDMEEQVRERVELARRFEPHHFERARPDGTVLEIRGRPIPGGGFITTYQDITARKRSELALRESETRLIEAQQIAGVGSFEADLATGLSAWSAEMYRIFDIEPDAHELIPPNVILDAVVPEERRKVRSMFVHAVTQAIDSLEFRVHHRDGSVRAVSARWRPIRDDTGKAVRIVGTVQDITERKKAEEEQQAAQRLLQTVFDTIPHPMFVKDRDKRLLMANKAYTRIFGTSMEQGQPETPPGEPNETGFRALLEQSDQVMFERGGSITEVFSIPHASGGKQYFQATRTPLRDGMGHVIGLVGVAEDITERQLFEEKLKANQRLLRTVFDTIPHTLTFKDCEDRYVIVNKAWSEMYGLSPEEAVGKHVLDVPGKPAEDKANTLEEDQLVLSGKVGTNVFEHLRTTKSGEKRLLQDTKSPLLDEQGHVVGVVGIAIDVTERKHMEEELRASQRLLKTTFNTLPHALFVKDVEGRYQMVNNAFAQFYGLSMEEVLNKRLQDLPIVNKEDMKVMLDTDRQVLDGFQKVLVQEIQFTRPSGQVTIRHLVKLPIHDDRGETIGILGMSEDITEQRRTEEQLRQAQKMEAMGQLTGGVAHDFNNLLTVILGNLELLGKKLGDDPLLIKLVQRATGAAERGAMLTQRLLAFSRKQALQPRLLGVNKMVLSILELLRHSLGETIEVHTALSKDLWPVLADPNQLENVLLNLAINARDAMPDGGRLTLQTQNVHPNGCVDASHNRIPSGDYVLVAVQDTGCGMSPEILKRVFDPFFTTKEVGRGSGLGLSMVYGFLQQSGGYVDIQSQVGEGTLVLIYLPRAGDRDEAMIDLAHTPKDIQGRAEKILVVEDNADVRRLAVSILEGVGYTALEAADAQAALEVLDATPDVALLFSDVVLPGGQTGFELADEAVKRRPDLKVLFTSGYTEFPKVHRGPLHDRIVLIPKPYREADLAEKIFAVLHRPDS